MKPEISVIVPVYNGEKYLKSAIKSVLNQTYDDWEIIIVNDGSTDNSQTIIDDYISKYSEKIKCYQQKNAGPSKARNTAIKNSSGEYIAILDCDDIAKSNRLELQKKYLENHPDVGLVGSHADIIDEHGNIANKIEVPTDQDFLQNNIINKNFFVHSSVMIRKRVFDECGLYREELPCAMDYEFILRVSEKYKIANMDQILSQWRMRNNSISVEKQDLQNRVCEVVRAIAKDKGLNNIDKIVLPKIKNIFKALNQKSVNYYFWARRFHDGGDIESAKKYLLKALIVKPINKEIWKYYFQNKYYKR